MGVQRSSLRRAKHASPLHFVHCRGDGVCNSLVRTSIGTQISRENDFAVALRVRKQEHRPTHCFLNLENTVLDGVLEIQVKPMSVLNCIPSNCTPKRPSYASARAASKFSAQAVTASTRPPFVTS